MNSEQEQRIAKFRALLEAGAIDEADFQAAVEGIIGRKEYQADASEGNIIAQGPGATAVGPSGVNVSGTVYGSIFTGDPTDDPAEALRIYRQVLLGTTATLPLRGLDVGAGDPNTAKQLGIASVYIGLDTNSFTWMPISKLQFEIEKVLHRRLGNLSNLASDDIRYLETLLYELGDPLSRMVPEKVHVNVNEMLRSLRNSIASPKSKKGPYDYRQGTDPREARANKGAILGAIDEITQKISNEFLRPMGAIEATINNPQLVLTSEPGGGKSTFVNHLAYCLAAHALYPDAGWMDHLPGWPAAEATLLPIPITLRDFAATIDIGKRAATPSDLWGFITTQLEEQNLKFATRAIESDLNNGRSIVLLDGLDEVTGDDRRAFIRDAVTAFADRYPGNRFVVTCRILAYQPPDEDESDLRLDAEHFPVFELAPFDEDKIDRFLSAWYTELARLGSVRTQDVDSLVGRLKAAVRRPDLWRMAPNPLLLTVMALVHSHQGRLPDARALLYEQTVDMLLWRWEEVKLSGQVATPTFRQLLQDAGRTELDLKRALWRLAFEAHGRSGDGDDALGDIAEAQLMRALVRLKSDDWQWAHKMVNAMKVRAGLLLERSPGVFTFPHRTFQEYLAGAHLSTQSDCAKAAAELGAQGALWREAILLAAGRLVHVGGDVERALMISNRLCPERPPDGEEGWRIAWLAGDVLREIGLERATDDEWGRELLKRIRYRLAELVSQGQLTPRERANAGNTLAELGDPRPGVGIQVVNERIIPNIDLCYVPPGSFWMGSSAEDPDAQEEETPLHEVDIPYGYWISRYPLTVDQFRIFVESESKLGKFADNLRSPRNHPVSWITWNDANLYCQWLTGLGYDHDWLPEWLELTLPSEAEWEKASRGGLLVPAPPTSYRLGSPFLNSVEVNLVTNSSSKRQFPWGYDKTLANRANCDEADFESTTPVGMYPSGASPYGVSDLSGNVAEWTRSRYRRYPFDLTRDRLNSKSYDASDRFVWRGGYFNSSPLWLRCSARGRYSPGDWFGKYGFRVVMVPLLRYDS